MPFLRHCIIGLLGLHLLVFLPLPAWATETAAGSTICLLDGRGEPAVGMPNCDTAPPCGDDSTNAAIYNNGNSKRLGLRLNPGLASTPVEAHGICRYLSNASKNGYFVPFRTPEEWSAFLNNPPPGVPETTNLAVHCAKPFNGQNSAKGLYYGQTSAQFDLGDTGDPVTADVSLPYWRTATTWPPAAKSCNSSHTFNNECYEEYYQWHCWEWVPQECTGQNCDSDGKNCVEYKYDCTYCGDPGSICAKTWYSWSETFDFIATAGNSDVENPSWSGQSSRTAGSTRPSQCFNRCEFDGHDCTNCAKPSDPLNGVCGVANGKSLTSAPSGGELCSSGSASGVTGTGPWAWTCAGQNGGSSAACFATKGDSACPPIEAWGNPIGNGYIDLVYLGVASGRAYSDTGTENPSSYYGGACWSFTMEYNDFVACIATHYLRNNVPGYETASACPVTGGWYLSPIKVNLSGGDAVMNSKTPTNFYLTLKDGRLLEGHVTGGLNPNEGWLMVRRIQNSPLVLQNGALNGDNWFGDRDRRSLNGYTDLAETFSAFVTRDENGSKYIPLRSLSSAERKAKTEESLKPGYKISDPSFDLRIIDASNREHLASDHFTRIYVDYRKVVEGDGPQNKIVNNVVLGRGVVTTRNQQNRSSIDQWFVLDLPQDFKPVGHPTKSKVWPAQNTGKKTVK